MLTDIQYSQENKIFIVTLTRGVGHFQASFCKSSDLINILTRVISISMFFKKMHGGIQRCKDPFHAFKFRNGMVKSKDVKIHSMHSNLTALFC